MASLRNASFGLRVVLDEQMMRKEYAGSGYFQEAKEEEITVVVQLIN